MTITQSIEWLQYKGTLFPALKFVVVLAGFCPRSPGFAAKYASRLTIPALSIYGKTDFLRALDAPVVVA